MGIKGVGIMSPTVQTNALTLLVNIFYLTNSSNWKSQQSALAGSSLFVLLYLEILVTVSMQTWNFKCQRRTCGRWFKIKSLLSL